MPSMNARLCLASMAVLPAAVTLSSCGGDGSPAPTSAQKDPTAITASDLRRDARFWDDQTPAGREKLATICKAQEGQDAEREASQQAANNPDADDADPLAEITAGQEAKTAVLEIETRDLAAKIDASAKTAPGRTIDEACADVVDSATGPTDLQIDGADRESILGADAYVADAADRVRITGTIEPVGDGMQLEVERRLVDEWEYVETEPPDADGSFALTLRAYRRNSNLYRIKAQGTGASIPAVAEIYFDRP
jgi:hypothetical protein